MPDNYIDLLLALLEESITKCYQHDFILIERNMEQASVARIYYYMQDALNNDEKFVTFSNYNLDNEYNKNGEHVKTTPRHPNGTRPDITLHRRGNNGGNLMVLEFKSHNGGAPDDDFDKLEDFTTSGIYDYCLGVSIRLIRGGAEYNYFQDGRGVMREGLRQ